MRTASAEGAREREQERAAPNAPMRRPSAEDDRRQRDEAATGGHAVLERPGLLEGEVGAGQPGEDAAEDDVAVAQRDDVDPDRLGGLRVLADGARPQAPARPEEQTWSRMTNTITRHRDRALVEEHLEDPADHRDGRPRGREVEGLEDAGAKARVRRDEQPVEVAGQAEGGDVDDRAADDLVGPDRDREPGVERRERPCRSATAGQDADDQRGRRPEDRRDGSSADRLGDEARGQERR